MSDILSTDLKKLEELSFCKNSQEVINETAKILNNPVLALNMEYEVISYSQNIPCDDRIWNEFLTMGILSHDTIDFINAEGFIDAAANTNTVAYLITDKLKYNRIFGKLFSKDPNIQIGSACMVESNSKFNENTPVLYEKFCEIFSEKLSNESRIQNYGFDYYKRMIATMIENKYESKRLYSAHVANIYNGLKSNIYIALVDISKSDLCFDEISEYIDCFKCLESNYKYFEYKDWVIVILSSEKKQLSINDDLEKLHNFFVAHNIYCGISDSFDNLFELDKYFSKALASLEKGKSAHTNKRIYLYGVLNKKRK